MNNALSSICSETEKEYTAADVPLLKEELSRADITESAKIEVIRGIRKLLTHEGYIQQRTERKCEQLTQNAAANDISEREMLKGEILPQIVQLLKIDHPQILNEAMLTLFNVASSDGQVLVDIGAVPPIVSLLSSPISDVRERSLRCLESIARESPALRDAILSEGVIGLLVGHVESPSNSSLISVCARAVKNLFSQPCPDLSFVAPAIPALVSIVNSHCIDAIIEALWALSFICDGEEEHIQAVIDSGVVKNLIEMLDHTNTDVVVPAIRTVGSIVGGNDKQTQAVVNSGLMKKVETLLDHPKNTIRKHTCFALSNIAGGPHDHIKVVMSKHGGMLKVVKLLMGLDDDWIVRKEAMHVVGNVATRGTDYQVMSLVECGAIEGICSVLGFNDKQVILFALDGLDAILKMGQKLGKDYVSFVDECDGTAKLEQLQFHESDEVYEKAKQMINDYLSIIVGSEVDDEAFVQQFQQFHC